MRHSIRRPLPILLVLTAVVAALPASAGAAVDAGVVDRTLVITGDAAADQIALTGTKASLQVAAGSQRFAVGRSRFSRVIVRPGAGDDAVQIEETAAVPALTIEGGLGIDTVRVPGTAESEEFTLQAVGNRARISRDTSPSPLDLASVEIANVRAGAGADLVDVGNLAGSRLQRVDADLGAGDGARDQIAAQGSAANEFLSAGGSLGVVNVSGLPGAGFIQIEGAQAADDRLTLFGGDGRDSISANSTLGDVIGLTVDGGAGPTRSPAPTPRRRPRRRGHGRRHRRQGRRRDRPRRRRRLRGLAQRRRQRHGRGRRGQRRPEPAWLERPRFRDGGPDGARLRLSHNVGAGAVDANDVEKLDIDLVGGADRLTAEDLAGTDVTSIDADVGVADNATDEVTVQGTTGADSVTVDGASVTGLAARVTVAPAEARDKLAINGLDGADSIDTLGVPATGIRIQADGGGGNDTVLGGPGRRRTRRRRRLRRTVRRQRRQRRGRRRGRRRPPRRRGRRRPRRRLRQRHPDRQRRRRRPAQRRGRLRRLTRWRRGGARPPRRARRFKRCHAGRDAGVLADLLLSAALREREQLSGAEHIGCLATRGEPGVRLVDGPADPADRARDVEGVDSLWLAQGSRLSGPIVSRHGLRPQAISAPRSRPHASVRLGRRHVSGWRAPPPVSRWQPRPRRAVGCRRCAVAPPRTPRAGTAPRQSRWERGSGRRDRPAAVAVGRARQTQPSTWRFRPPTPASPAHPPDPPPRVVERDPNAIGTAASVRTPHRRLPFQPS